MAPKICTITAAQRQRSNTVAERALDAAAASGSVARLAAIAARSHRLMQAWVAAGRPKGAAAIAQIVRAVDGPGR